MKIEDLDNYVLRVTEKYMRYYYSSEAQLLKNETTDYEITKDLEIATSVDYIRFVNYIIDNDELLGIRLQYTDENECDAFADILFNAEALEIKLVEGNPDISRVSKCILELVQK